MRILVTGHEGYIGTVLVPMLLAAGDEVVGLDNGLFTGCTFIKSGLKVPQIRKDVRDAQTSDLEGFDAVIHLAGLSNDPLGNLNSRLTYDINHRAVVRLAHMAKERGISRFLFSSSCSLYGAAGETMVKEDTGLRPVTPYGQSKVDVEHAVGPLASDEFTPVFLRASTAYGFSPRLRFDLVVNNLLAWAFTTGKVYIKSDGTPWRPLVHVEDIARAYIAALEAPRELVHGKAFNVGQTSEN